MSLRIWVHDSTGHPFQIELSRALARRGHQVLHSYFSDLESPKGALAPQADDPPSLKIEALSTGRKFPKYDYWARWREEAVYGRMLQSRLLAWKPDVVLASNLAIGAALPLQRACARQGIAYVHWLQDIYGRAARSILKQKLWWPGWLIGRWIQNREESLWRSSQAIVAITDDFRADLTAAGVDDSRVSVVPNWAPLDEMPQQEKDNSWSRRQGLHETFNFIYTGTLGMKHNPELLVDLAQSMRSRPEVRVVVCSEGLGADYLQEQRAKQGLENLVLLAFQDYADVPQVMGAADVLLVLLEESAGRYSVPSKTLSYLCAGRPILMAGPLENLAAKIIHDFQVGKTTLPSNRELFIDHAANYIKNPAKRTRSGKKARQYAEEHFDIDSIVRRFEGILCAALPGQGQ